MNMVGVTDSISARARDITTGSGVGGARRLRKVPNTTPVGEILAIYHEDGGVIIGNFLSSRQVEAFNVDLDPNLSPLAPGAPREVPEGAAEFFGLNTKRLMNVVDKSKTFRDEILEVDLMYAVSDGIFGAQGETYWLAAAQVIEIGPDSRPQDLHRDLEGWPNFKALGPSHPEILFSFIVALTDFTDENGATRVIPGSNLWDFDSSFDQSMTVPAEMEACDALLFSGKVVHGDGANRSASEYRRGITIAVLPGYLTPNEAFTLNTRIETVRALSPRAQRMVGYRWHHSPRQNLWVSEFNDVGLAYGLGGPL